MYVYVYMVILNLHMYDDAPIGGVRGPVIDSVLSLNPRNADYRWIADESYNLLLLWHTYTYTQHHTIFYLQLHILTCGKYLLVYSLVLTHYYGSLLHCVFNAQCLFNRNLHYG